MSILTRLGKTAPVPVITADFSTVRADQTRFLRQIINCSFQFMCPEAGLNQKRQDSTAPTTRLAVVFFLFLFFTISNRKAHFPPLTTDPNSPSTPAHPNP